MGLRKTDVWMMVGMECPNCFEELQCAEDVRCGDRFKCPSCGKSAEIGNVTGPHRADKSPRKVEVESRV